MIIVSHCYILFVTYYLLCIFVTHVALNISLRPIATDLLPIVICTVAMYAQSICDWLWENPPVMHKDNYVEKHN